MVVPEHSHQHGHTLICPGHGALGRPPQPWPRQGMWGYASTPALSCVHGGTQIIFAPHDSLRAGCFPLCPCPGFPAFEFASPQKYHVINKPPRVRLCTVACPVPVPFSTSSSPSAAETMFQVGITSRTRFVTPWARPILAVPAPGLGTGWGSRRPVWPILPFIHSWWLPLPRSNLSPHFL